MDARAAKLALARQKLKSHQEKKHVSTQKADTSEDQYITESQQIQAAVEPVTIETERDENIVKPNETSHPTTSDTIHHPPDDDKINVTEILILGKRNLELQVDELQSKLSQLEKNYTIAVNNNTFSKQQINNLEHELQILNLQYLKASEEISQKEKIISELNNVQLTVRDENNNLLEQLELTKSMLTTKELENSSLHNQLNSLQSQLEALQLQLQQITSGGQTVSEQQSKYEDSNQNLDILLQKITNLEEQLKTMQKERDQINCHYEQYVAELNKQLKLTLIKNDELSQQVQNLIIRENNLIEQISEMEIRIQNFRQQQPPLESHQLTNDNTQMAEMKSLQEKYQILQEQLQGINKKYEELQNKYSESKAKVQDLTKAKESESEHENISLSKLTADIASDKLAAQKATEQNKKLKVDLQELEEAFVKISKDKLELIEKVSAEKYLNRELTIKLAEVEEKAIDLQTKLRAKDDEMIRLQNSYRELEHKYGNNYKQKGVENKGSPLKNLEQVDHDHDKCSQDLVDSNTFAIHHLKIEKHSCFNTVGGDNVNLPKQDAMVKLQDRFLKIMDEVANLSDEKHRLEHIILQLQNETDTICEYVALYQQQRSLLKKRDAERSAQIKFFQTECELLKTELEELSSIIIRLAQDPELAIFFETETRLEDLAKVMKLLTNLKNNTLIDPHKTSSELKNFYPCSCCSGQLIDV